MVGRVNSTYRTLSQKLPIAGRENLWNTIIAEHYLIYDCWQNRPIYQCLVSVALHCYRNLSSPVFVWNFYYFNSFQFRYRIPCRSWWTPSSTVDPVRTPPVSVALVLSGGRLWTCHPSAESTRSKKLYSLYVKSVALNNFALGLEMLSQVSCELCLLKREIR